MDFKELENITKGKLHSTFPSDVGTIYFDTRQIANPNSNGIFIAISGKNHDGNMFIEEAFSRGIHQFIVEKRPPGHVLKDSNVLVVINSLRALQKIAISYRSSFNIPVIGITGSNGKTIVKEWLSTLLQSKFNVIKSPGSYNSQLGVALSVLTLKNDHTLGIFEAGISKGNEMDVLEQMIHPSIGVFTNIGPAHEEGFSTIKEKIKEKLKLFSNSDVIIFNDWNSQLVEAIESMPGVSEKVLIRWGTKSEYKIIFDGSVAEIATNNMSFKIKIPYRDLASHENLGHAIATMLYLGFKSNEITAGIPLLQGISMRLSVKKGINNSILVDDSYNNDVVGLKSALNFIGHQKPDLPILLILSDIIQSKASDTYSEIASIINEYQVNTVIAVGNEVSVLEKLLKIPVHIFPDTKSLLNEIATFLSEPSRILVKGARAFRLELVVDSLSEQVHSTRLELYMNNLIHNLNEYRSQLSQKTKIMVMVKALAYGSDSTQVARILAYHGVDYLGVAYVDEGVELRKSGIKIPIMVMNPTVQSFLKLKEYELEPEIYSRKQLLAYANFESMPAIHLKCDTGMHRLGFNEDELNFLTEKINKHDIKVASIFSHLAAASDKANQKFTGEQIKLFKDMADKISNSIDQSPLFHICNSSAILSYPEAHFDMVRLGIGLHGIDPTDTISSQLLPVGKLISTVSQVKSIQPDETVGYNRSGIVSEETKIATIAIGYADGYRRNLGNGNAEVWINNQRAKTVGDICMDMIMVDVQGMDVNEGDEVEIFGPNIPLKEIAENARTISYEVLTSISGRVKRIYVYD